MLFNKTFKMEDYIIAELKKNNWSCEKTLNRIYNKYPFFHKRQLFNAMKEIITKKLNNERISGIWIKIGKELKLLSNINDDAYEHSSGNYWLKAPVPSKIGRGTDFAELSQGQDSNVYSPPDNIPIRIRIYEDYEKIKKRILQEAPGLNEKKLNEIALNELTNLNYTKEEIEKINNLLKSKN
jgi:hypothetical protein